ncbi:MAG: HAMP domain-containing histidine kinase [Bifidobacteriaceae bacterium]|jgi:signal transduction histidine kinase|nr:HAMP domain-containing histidine kinase [Bifidobacteriaceae bacterium]
MAKPSTFQLRLVGAIATLAAIGLATAGGLAYLVELRRTDSRIAGSLERAVSELHRYADAHPSYGVDRLIDGAVAQSVNAADECTLGRVEGQTWTHAGASAVCGSVLADQALTRQFATVSAASAVRVRQFEGDSGGYAYVAVPVTSTAEVAAVDRAEGSYVVVIDSGAERAEVARSYLSGYLPVALGTVLAITAAGWFAAGRILRPLRDVAATTRQITAGAGGQPDIGRRVPTAGPAETADLAIAMNTMLDSLRNAFESERRLLDDVGHQLRTPLTVVQGHLELMDLTDRGEVEATRWLVLDELGRMRRLTDSLVTLAAADAPGFVRLAPLDLGPWFDELVDKARGLGDRDWLVEARDEAQALADRHRLTEAMLELATNAVKHSESGSVVAFGLRREADTVRLWVRDEGRGIELADQARVFERFGRASRPGGPDGPDGQRERSGQRGAGAGLGLAIVSRIAASHGGSVQLWSVRGRGSVFTLALPLVRSVPPEARRESAPVVEG